MIRELHAKLLWWWAGRHWAQYQRRMRKRKKLTAGIKQNAQRMGHLRTRARELWGD
jgi:hypothetical protein